MHWGSQYCGSLCFSKDQGDGDLFLVGSYKKITKKLHEEIADFRSKHYGSAKKLQNYIITLSKFRTCPFKQQPPPAVQQPPPAVKHGATRHSAAATCREAGRHPP